MVAEHEAGKTVSAGTLAAVTAASKLGGDVSYYLFLYMLTWTYNKIFFFFKISVLIMGKDVSGAAAHAAKVKNVTKVLVIDSEVFANGLPEDLSKAIQEIAPKYTHIIAPSSNFSKNFIPRAAALLNSSPLSDVIAVVDENTFKRPVYAGNAISTVKMSNAHKFLLVRSTAFDKAADDNSASAPIENVTVSTTKSAKSTFVSASVVKSDRPELASAKVVVSGGRGLKSGENFAILEKLADKLGGAVGASRAAVDAGFVPNEYQVGQTGKVVAPNLYIAVGISGAIQHLSGMKDSKTIVAINKDKDAPIFQVADYGLVEDLFKAVPELESKL